MAVWWFSSLVWIKRFLLFLAFHFGSYEPCMSIQFSLYCCLVCIKSYSQYLCINACLHIGNTTSYCRATDIFCWIMNTFEAILGVLLLINPMKVISFLFQEEINTRTFMAFQFSPINKTTLMENPLHEELDPIKKSEVEVLLNLWKKFGVYITCVHIQLKLGISQPNYPLTHYFKTLKRESNL